MKRKFISVYLPYINEDNNRINKNVCFAFNQNELKFYKIVKKYNMKQVRQMIRIFSYNQLIEISEREKRKPTELIKLRLKEKLLTEDDNLGKYIKYDPAQVKKWIEDLQADNKKSKKRSQIINFLQDILD